MSLTLEMSPMVGEPEIQARRELREPREFAITALSRCECHCCKGGIEFEASAFREKFRTNLLVVGQSINCPHCGRATSICMSNKLDKVAAINLSCT